MQGLVADASWLRDTFVPGYSFSERVVPLLLWVPSCPPSPLVLRGHLSCWRALLGMAQLRDEQSSWISPTWALWIWLLDPLKRSGPLVLPGVFCPLLHSGAFWCPMRVAGPIPAPCWHPGPHPSAQGEAAPRGDQASLS